MAKGTTGRKAQHVLPHGWILGHELNGRIQLAGAASNVHAEPLAHPGGHQCRAAEEVQGRHNGAHDVVGAHHLRAAKRAKRLEDVVLRAVGEAVEEQVDAQQQQSPGHVGLVRSRRLLVLAARVQGEDGHTRGDGSDDQILVEGIALPEDGNVQEHDGEQLAALGQQKGNVVDVRKAGIAKGTRQTVGDGDERERPEDAARGENRRDGRAFRSRGQEIDEAYRGGEQRLDGVEEDGEVPDLWRVGRTVGLGCQFLLEERPGQTLRKPSQLVG